MAHPEHALAQKAGKQRWYESYAVQVADLNREYSDRLSHSGKPDSKTED